MPYKTIIIEKDIRKERLKELKTKGVKNLSKAETEELLELVLSVLGIQ